MIDFHIHTAISPDAKMTLGDAVQKARQLGITHMAITDHHEFINDDAFKDWKIKDLKAYGKAIDELNSKYGDIFIAKGIEIGQPNYAHEEIKKVLDTISFDFVIASIHFVNDVDPFDSVYFADKSKHQAYLDYLQATSECVDIMDDRTSVLGHIGYVARYSPYKDKKLRYEDFTDIIDEILHKIIDRGIGIELNTSNYGKVLDEIMPPISIIKRYKELGGDIITIGSDAHITADIGKEYNKAKLIALDAGFKYVCIFKKLKKEYIKL